MRYHEVLQDAITTFGERNRIASAIESLNGLSALLARAMDERKDMIAITGEMASVQIALDELEIIFGNRGAVNSDQILHTRILNESIKRELLKE